MTTLDDINEQVKAAANRLYTDAAKQHGATNRAVLLDRETRQWQRFAELARFVDMNDPTATLVDVGCGNAELYRYLAYTSYRGAYLGFDINAPLLEQARSRFPGIDVRQTDILTEPLEERFDFVVMSTIFNLDHGQTLEWCQSFLTKMWQLTSRAMVFNLLTTHASFRDPAFCYFDPSEMLAFCIKNLSPRVSLIHHGVSYNYTIAVYKEPDRTLPCAL